jgi:hypothetical protein
MLLAGCATTPSSSSTAPAPTPATSSTPLVPSSNRIVGRVLAIDPERAFAFIDLAADAPAGALANGAELTTRTLDLRETARLRASSYVRGKTLGTRIVSGQPAPGDEVVWRAP